MVVANPEPDSGGGREGFLALVAIAVVLFFIIRIYSDYVTATGKVVKPGHKRQTAPIPSPRTTYAEVTPSERSVSRRDDGNTTTWEPKEPIVTRPAPSYGDNTTERESIVETRRPRVEEPIEAEAPVRLHRRKISG